MRVEQILPVVDHAVIDRPLELSVIVPVFNEIANIQPLLFRLSLVLADIHWEAIFVDDNSPDGTADYVRRFAMHDRRVRIVHRIGRRGLSSAVTEGMLASAAPILAVLDGDLQHDEAALPALFGAIARGDAEIAIGTRYADGGGTGAWSPDRLRASRIATRIARLAVRTPISDPMSGFFAIRRETFMAALPRMSGIGFKFLLDVAASLPEAPRIAEIPYHFRAREAGESKADAQIAMEYLALIADKLVGRWIPLRLLSFLAVGGLGVGVHMAVLSLALWTGATFLNGEIAAVATAMTFNFVLNNAFTYRDQRLRGLAAWRGLISFCLVCSIGAIANIGIGTWLNDMDNVWWLSGLAGVIVGAIWNFTATSFVTWRKP